MEFDETIEEVIEARDEYIHGYDGLCEAPCECDCLNESLQEVER